MNDQFITRSRRLKLFLTILATVCPVSGSTVAHASPDGAGGALRAWQTSVPAGAEIRVQRLDAAGMPKWGREGARIVGAVHAEHPTIVDDGSGGAYVAWLDRRRGATDRGVRALRLGPTGSVADGWPADGIGLNTLTGWASWPALTSDGEGGVWAVWCDRRADQGGVRGDDVFAARVTAGGALAPGMEPNGVRVCTAPWHQRDPQVAMDGAGGILVAWTDHRGNESDVFAQHLDASGRVAPGWPSNGLRMSTDAGEQRDAAIATDGAGGAYVAWFESRGPEGALLIGRVGPDGGSAEGWAEAGLVMAGSVVAGTRARLAPEPDGGVIVEWLAEDGPVRVKVDAGGSFRPVVDPTASPPLAFRVERPRPNPTSGGTRLELTLPRRGHVKMDLMDVAGRLVRRIENRDFEPGVHTLLWDGSDAKGEPVAPSVYFLRVTTPSGSAVHPIVALQ